MKLKELLQKIKQINYKKVVAVIFLVAIFYIGSVTLPQTARNVIWLLKGEQPGILETIKQIDKDYREMLELRDHDLRNKGFYINFNGLMARIMGQRYMNDRVKLDNGHLYELKKKNDISLAAAQLQKFYIKQSGNEKEFLFVLAPCQDPKYEDIIPTGYSSYSNINSDELLFILSENDVPFLDLREELYIDGISHTDAFFVTDHHWKPETGLWAYAKIVETLMARGTIKSIDNMYIDIDKFNVKIFPDYFLGASGKRTGIYYAGVDDFALITPDFVTNLSINIPSRDIDMQGEFIDVAIDLSRIQKDFFNASLYAAYGHGRPGLIEYRNDIAPVDLKVLAIGDSYSKVPFTFLPLVFSTCDELDMRDFTGNFAEYYYEFDPDIVILLVNANQAAAENTTYDFFDDIN